MVVAAVRVFQGHQVSQAQPVQTQLSQQFPVGGLHVEASSLGGQPETGPHQMCGDLGSDSEGHLPLTFLSGEGGQKPR